MPENVEEKLPKTYLQLRCSGCYQKYYEHELNKFRLCEKCYNERMKLSHRNPYLAVLLTLIVPGLGQGYNRDASGIIFVFLWAVCFILVITVVFLPFVYLFAGIQAYIGAKKIIDVLPSLKEGDSFLTLLWYFAFL
jgi:hypothetical protein